MHRHFRAAHFLPARNGQAPAHPRCRLAFYLRSLSLGFVGYLPRLRLLGTFVPELVLRRTRRTRHQSNM